MPEEFARCRPYFIEELQGLRNVRAVVALGMIGFKTYFSARKELGWKNPSRLPDFSHSGVSVLEDGVHVISSYHPSQQNTQTGKLTEPMFDDVFRKARQLLDSN